MVILTEALRFDDVFVDFNVNMIVMMVLWFYFDVEKCKNFLFFNGWLALFIYFSTFMSRITAGLLLQLHYAFPLHIFVCTDLFLVSILNTVNGIFFMDSLYINIFCGCQRSESRQVCFHLMNALTPFFFSF